jgi:hypothetical protein
VRVAFRSAPNEPTAEERTLPLVDTSPPAVTVSVAAAPAMSVDRAMSVPLARRNFCWPGMTEPPTISQALPL